MHELSSVVEDNYTVRREEEDLRVQWFGGGVLVMDCHSGLVCGWEAWRQGDWGGGV